MVLQTNIAIVVIIRIIMLAFFSIVLFTLWHKSFKRQYSDFKFLFFISFAAQTAAKIFDLYIYSIVGSLEAVNSDPQYIVLIKFRYFLMLGLIIPVFSMMIFIWFNEKRKLQNILNLSFISIATVLILIGQDYKYYSTLISIIAFPLMLLSIITFINLYRHQRLPQFNSQLMAIAFICYMIAQIMRPVLTTGALASDDLLALIELIEAGIWLMMGLSFVIRPKYDVKQVQTIVI